jgi:chromate reductase, NAD(P)H dehydrogenase (quinone)
VFVTSRLRVLLISGSLRSGSTNSAALRTAASVAPGSVETRLYEGMAALSAFNPDLDGDAPPPEVVDLRHEIRTADALVFSTPEYAGGLPGSFKNLLDWTVGDARPGSIYRKPVAWFNVSPRGATAAHDSLRRVLGYVGAEIVEPACIEVPVTGAMVGDDSLVTDAAVASQFAESLALLTGAYGP